MVAKSYLILGLLCAMVFSVQAQESALYTIPVSDAYYAKVYLEDTNEIRSEGWIGVYDKKSDKELIRLDSTNLFVDYDENGLPSVNIVELPYGSQSVIIYDDFNFDGIKDFALRDGNNSCYGGPSYQVYLANGKGNFKYDENFTDLAQSYCGFFSVDYDQKRIYTMTKSGCCWHWYYTFDVADNKPRIREEIEERMSNSIPFIFQNKITSWDVKGKKTIKNEDLLYLNETGYQILFSFDLKDRARTVMLIDGDDALYYVFAKQNERGDSIAEYCYPSEYIPDPIKLQYMSYNVINNMETLTFASESASYQVYNSADKVGVKVVTKGKTYDMPGDLRTRKTNYFFDKLEGVAFENLHFDADTRLDSRTN